MVCDNISALYCTINIAAVYKSIQRFPRVVWGAPVIWLQ